MGNQAVALPVFSGINFHAIPTYAIVEITSAESLDKGVLAYGYIPLELPSPVTLLLATQADPGRSGSSKTCALF